MSDAKVEKVRALAEPLSPKLHEDAKSARIAEQEAIATFLETSAAKMDFVIAAVSSWLPSLAESICIQEINLWDRVPGSLCISPAGCFSAHDGALRCHWPGHQHKYFQKPLSARHVQFVTQVMHRTPCCCAGDREHEETDSRESEGAGLAPWGCFMLIGHLLCRAAIRHSLHYVSRPQYMYVQLSSLQLLNLLKLRGQGMLP